MRYHVFLYEENTTRFLKNLPRNDAIIVFYGADTDKSLVREKIKRQKASSQNADLIFTISYTESAFNESFTESVVNQLLSELKEDDQIVLRPASNKEYWDQIAMDLRRNGRSVSMRKARDAFYDTTRPMNTKTTPIKAPQKPINAWSGFAGLSPPSAEEEEEQEQDDAREDPQKTEEIAEAPNVPSIMDMFNAGVQRGDPVQDEKEDVVAINPHTEVVRDERDRFIEKGYDIPEPEEELDAEDQSDKEKTDDADIQSMNDILFAVPDRGGEDKDHGLPIDEDDIPDVDQDSPSGAGGWSPNEKFMKMLDAVRGEDEIPTKDGMFLQVSINKINGDFVNNTHNFKNMLQVAIDDVIPEVEALNVAALLRESETPKDFDENFRELYGDSNPIWRRKVKNNFDSLREQARKIKM